MSLVATERNDLRAICQGLALPSCSSRACSGRLSVYLPQGTKLGLTEPSLGTWAVTQTVASQDTDFSSCAHGRWEKPVLISDAVLEAPIL